MLTHLSPPNPAQDAREDVDVHARKRLGVPAHGAADEARVLHANDHGPREEGIACACTVCVLWRVWQGGRGTVRAAAQPHWHLRTPPPLSQRLMIIRWCSRRACRPAAAKLALPAFGVLLTTSALAERPTARRTHSPGRGRPCRRALPALLGTPRPGARAAAQCAPASAFAAPSVLPATPSQRPLGRWLQGSGCQEASGALHAAVGAGGAGGAVDELVMDARGTVYLPHTLPVWVLTLWPSLAAFCTQELSGESSEGTLG